MLRVDFPAEKGTYAILFHLEKEAIISIGRSGTFAFPIADYVYIGSAQGTGGLRSRIRHHLESAAMPRWHMDYLRGRIKLVDVLYITGSQQMECTWSQALAKLDGAIIPVPAFGSSDCRSGCQAHLVAFPDGLDIDRVRKALSLV